MGIEEQIDKLIDLGEDIKSRLDLLSELASDHFAGANKMVADEPAKEPEHPAGPKPDPGEGYRILSKNPLEELAEGDEFLHPGLGRWAQSVKSMCGGKKQDVDCWYRRKIGFPAKEAEPAWEPKVGDWVRVTRPENWQECRNPDWSTVMHQYDDNVMQVSCYEKRWGAWVANFYGVDWFFHRDWLSPAEPPAKENPPEPEYREPVLPGDLGKWAEFSQDGINWIRYKLCGCYKEPESSLTIWSEKNIGFRHCRIKKES